MNRGSRGGGRYYSTRGRSPRSAGRFVSGHSHVGVHSNDASLDHESGSSRIGRQNSEIASVSSVTKQFNSMLTPDYPCRVNSDPLGVGNISPNVGNFKVVQNVPEAEDRTPKSLDFPSVVEAGYETHHAVRARSIQTNQSREAGEENSTSSHFSCTPLDDVTYKIKEPSQTMGSGKSSSEATTGDGEFENSSCQHKGFSFDICVERTGNVVKLKAPLLVKNRAKRNETKRSMQGDNIKMLRPGMVLLKGYLPLLDQVKLIKTCRDLGRGSGGFYQPGFRNGAALHLKMMCLGKNWDPETSIYGDERPIDGAKPPLIPDEFKRLVNGAIQECHDYLKLHSILKNARDILPSMSPNICIVNFYTKIGRLGLHQDKDESQESLRKGLPVISFSLGDSAEFLYGDGRDIDKAEKVVLESGDVLIFGGKSRHIFHGVNSIIPDTAPKVLLEETNLRPGRLNLTFREY